MIFYLLYLQDELEDDDSSIMSKSLLDAHEDAILKSPVDDKPEVLLKENDPLPQRKITLKRNLSNITPLSTTTPPTIASDDTKKIKLDSAEPEITTASNENTNEDDKKVVKLTELTAKERLELRAKKFGAPVSSDTKKLARAERFGTKTDINGINKASITSNAVPASADVLKKRAERFGVSVSAQMINLENQEKLNKRKERFGNATASAKTTTSSLSSDDYAEKARLRLERFKTSVK